MPENNQLSSKSDPRVPRHSVADVINQKKTIQVNHCRTPWCENYGKPPRTIPTTPGPSAQRDPHYKLHSASWGVAPSLLCKICKQNPPIKSNVGIAEEIARLIEMDGLWTLEEQTACKTEDCENFGHTVAKHPRAYSKRGHSTSGGRIYECKACHRRVVASTAVRLHADNRARAADVFSRIANKAPLRCTVRGARLKSTSDYYRILDFIHGRCQTFSATVDRALMEGRLKLPEKMIVESDAQSYLLNWISRLDRRNIDIFGYCSVDSQSRFILGFHHNYDANVDGVAVNIESAKAGDLSGKEPYRKYARYWLAGDDLRSGRSKNFQTRSIRAALADQIETLYAAAASRADVEDIELEHMDATYRTPFLRNGLLVHMPYTVYAHWYLLRRLLVGAGVEQMQFHFDIDSTSRAAFLCSFIEEIKARQAHGFYVRYDKNLTVDERLRVVTESRAKRRKERNKLPAAERNDVDLILMKRSLADKQPYGKWQDMWCDHPNPTMNEPYKAMSWLTPDPSLDEDTVARMFLDGRLARVDNTFQLTRRLINAFERPIGTPSGQNAVWHGYQPYNPAMVEKYITIFRAVSNWIQVGDDGKTPAMRLGFTDRPLSYEDILWPGEEPPIPQRVRRPKRKRPQRGPRVISDGFEGLLAQFAGG